jgi:hypothetical protein
MLFFFMVLKSLPMKLKYLAQKRNWHAHSVSNFLGPFYDVLYSYVGPGSSVGIATDYGLDGPGIESRWGRDFSHLSRLALESTQPPVQWVRVFPGGKAAGAWC